MAGSAEMLAAFRELTTTKQLDRIDDGAEAHHAHTPLKLVHVQLEPDVGAEFPGEGGVNAVPKQLQQIGAVELFCRRQLAKRGQHFG